MNTPCRKRFDSPHVWRLCDPIEARRERQPHHQHLQQHLWGPITDFPFGKLLRRCPIWGLSLIFWQMLSIFILWGGNSFPVSYCWDFSCFTQMLGVFHFCHEELICNTATLPGHKYNNIKLLACCWDPNITVRGQRLSCWQQLPQIAAQNATSSCCIKILNEIDHHSYQNKYVL